MITDVVIQTWTVDVLLVPPTNFINRPFQNWTGTSTQLIGTIS
jgi:hypothetical protein